MAIFKTILTVLFCIFGFLLAVAFIAFTAMRPGNIPRVVEAMNVSQIVADAGINDELIEEINASVSGDLEIDRELVEEFLQRENVSAQLDRVAGEFVTAIAEGDFDFFLSSEDIVDILRDIEDDIYEEFDYRLLEEDIDAIVETLNEQGNLEELSVGRILEEAGIDTEAVFSPTLLFSAVPLVITGILGGMILLGIFMLNLKRLKAAFLCTGIMFTAAGLICMIAPLLSNLFGGAFGHIDIVTGMLELMLFPGAVCLGFGVAVIVVSFILKTQESKEHELEI
jgi:hypothetical protein